MPLFFAMLSRLSADSCGLGAWFFGGWRVAALYPGEREKAALGTIDPARALAITRAYVEAFFGEYLEGREIALAERPLARIPRNHLRNKQEIDCKATGRQPESSKRSRLADGGQWNFTPLRLPYAVKDIFSDWLERHFPERKDKVLNRIGAMRGGKLNDPNFGSRMRGEGIFAEQLSRMYEVACRKAGLAADHTELSVAHFRRAEGAQMSLF